MELFRAIVDEGKRYARAPRGIFAHETPAQRGKAARRGGRLLRGGKARRGRGLAVMGKWPLLSRPHCYAHGGSLAVMGKWPLLSRPHTYSYGGNVPYGPLGKRLVGRGGSHVSHTKYGVPYVARNPRPHMVRGHLSHTRYGRPEMVRPHMAAGARRGGGWEDFTGMFTKLAAPVKRLAVPAAKYTIGRALGGRRLPRPHMVRGHLSHTRFGRPEFVRPHMAAGMRRGGAYAVRGHMSHSKYGKMERVMPHMARGPRPHLVRGHLSHTRLGRPELVRPHLAAGMVGRNRHGQFTHAGARRPAQPKLASVMRMHGMTNRSTGGRIVHRVRPHVSHTATGRTTFVRGHLAAGVAMTPHRVRSHVRVTPYGMAPVRSHHRGGMLSLA